MEAVKDTGRREGERDTEDTRKEVIKVVERKEERKVREVTKEEEEEVVTKERAGFAGKSDINKGKPAVRGKWE